MSKANKLAFLKWFNNVPSMTRGWLEGQKDVDLSAILLFSWLFKSFNFNTNLVSKKTLDISDDQV